ncbi:class I SAM-dependent methyltransferase [Sphingomonas solaris]|uniref:Class I SAM-dependent methyltransferase n=1 Tax=Alterirhizorhabdus solaris TaxID=2529389 RepID=A0A558R8C3_9SPHN|nr:class I SAM-dependent methyltransferase [Sphingomonas solaris]TVV75645.1 class I SAM-dependent methyltransferase [Sphingomonas solaris]
MDRETYDNMARIDGAHWWFVARRRIIDRLIRAQVPLKSDARILEMGCGTGSNIALLGQFGAVDAVEPDGPARALATARTGIEVKGGLLPDGVDLADGAYDMIAMLDVLEHIPDDGPALAALLPKLAPGGRIVVTVPAGPGLWSAHDTAHHHQRRYTAGSLREVFEANGYRVRHLTHFNTVLYPLVVAARAAGRLMKREGGDDAMPPAPVNAVLKALFGAERYWVPRRTLPFGVSLAIVAEPA